MKQKALLLVGAYLVCVGAEIYCSEKGSKKVDSLSVELTVRNSADPYAYTVLSEGPVVPQMHTPMQSEAPIRQEMVDQPCVVPPSAIAAAVSVCCCCLAVTCICVTC